MSQVETNPQAEAIARQLERLNWMIPDAKLRVAKAADQMLWRAKIAVADATNLINDQPCSLSWINFAEGDLRAAQEAEAELNKLLEQHKLLTYLAGK